MTAAGSLADLSLANLNLASLGDALAARTPAPGGGAAAAAVAALGYATGAMAARYTSGVKYAAVEAQALALAEHLDRERQRALVLADADAAAYARVQALKADPTAKSAAEAEARGIPAELLRRCADAVVALRAFRPLCNPWLVSDIDVAIHLLVGAGRSAQVTLLVNRPPAEDIASAAEDLRRLDLP